nr:MAG TPA: terminase small subunit [Bacteriophage sp.]
MGRKALPTEVKRLKGTLQPCRTNAREPQIEGEVGEPPEYLSDRAKEIWANVVSWLPKEVLKPTDRAILETYCNMCALREVLQDRVNKFGAVSATKNEISAAFNALVKCNADIVKAASELGLTPSARSKVVQGYGDPTKNDEFTLDMFEVPNAAVAN